MAIQLIPTNPFNPDRLYKLFILGCVIVLALIVSDMFRSCANNEQVAIHTDTIKDIKRKDSVKDVVIIKDSIRDKYITKWRTKHDTISVTEIISLCDSIIYVDSSLISSLKSEIVISDYHKQVSKGCL